MKKDIKNYLLSKDKKDYSDFDFILEAYYNGEIKKLLSSYEGVNVYSVFNKRNKNIQVEYNFHNIYVIIDFFEDKYNAVIYPMGIDADYLEKQFVDYEYGKCFNLESLLKEIDLKIKNHKQLKDMTLIKKKKKLYSVLSLATMSLPIAICGSIYLYCAIFDKEVKGNIWWVIFIIVIPLIISFVFDKKSR